MQNHELEQCMRYSKPGDMLLFMQDGVYNLVANTKGALEICRANTSALTFYAIKEDIQAHHIAKPMSHVKLVDYSNFVDLVAIADKVISW